MKNQSLYLQTVFQYSPADKPDAFWVVTAHNPNGKSAAPGDNILADAQLHEELKELKITSFRVTGLSPDESHAEPGWGFACEEATALRLGRQFQQEAIFHFQEELIELVCCENGDRQALDKPEGRNRDPRSLRYYTLHVGSPPGRNRIDPLEYTGVCTRVAALFSGFTIQRAEGCYGSRFEDTLVIHIASREPGKVIEVAHSLRCFLNQEGVGLSHGGIYQRVRDWSDNEVLLETFDAAANANHRPQPV